MPRSPRAGGRQTVLVVVGVLAALGLVAAAAVTFVGTEAETSHPDVWDPRIEPLARFVEQERGLPFDHPVYVDFLDPEQFSEDVTAEMDVTDEMRADADRYAGFYRAFGLVSGEVDLLGTTTDLVADGVAAYYMPDTKRITVSGELDANGRATVVHELTHAWQDQHYDFAEIERELDDVTFETYTAIVEGDATRIEYRFYETLSETEMAEAGDAAVADFEEADFERFPAALVAEFGAPYALGEPFVGVITAERGETAVEIAMRTPPASTEMLLDPFAYLDDDLPIDVEEPELGDGEEHFESGVMGALSLYLVLNERLGPRDALAAADGWAGDAYVAFTRGETVCVRATVAAESPSALDTLGFALGAWARSMPAGAANVTVGPEITVEACDPGPGAVMTSLHPGLDPLTYPSVRSTVWQGALEGSGDRQMATCFADQYVAALTIEHLMAVDDTYAAELEAVATAAQQSCIDAG